MIFRLALRGMLAHRRRLIGLMSAIALGVMFDELFTWLPDIRTTSEPDFLFSSFIHGIKRMDCEFTPASVPAATPSRA